MKYTECVEDEKSKKINKNKLSFTIETNSKFYSAFNATMNSSNSLYSFLLEN